MRSKVGRRRKSSKQESRKQESIRERMKRRKVPGRTGSKTGNGLVEFTKHYLYSESLLKITSSQKNLPEEGVKTHTHTNSHSV